MKGKQQKIKTVNPIQENTTTLYPLTTKH